MHTRPCANLRCAAHKAPSFAVQGNSGRLKLLVVYFVLSLSRFVQELEFGLSVILTAVGERS